MMVEKMDEERMGIVRISDEVIAACVMRATLATSGVHAVSAGSIMTLAKKLSAKDSAIKLVKVNQNDEGIVIEIPVVVEYGVKIPAVAWDIQENVKREIEDMTDSKVLAVNIHVTGVNINETQA